MRPPLPQTCVIVSSTRNIFGDIVNTGTAGETINCKFRQIIDFQTTATNREEYTSNAMLWTESDANVAIGTVILFDGVYYRTIEVIEARKIDSSAIEFLKCKLERLKNVASVS